MLAKILRPGAFLLALACFILPFMRVSCNNQMIMEPKGYQLAFGQEKQKRDTTKTTHATKEEKSSDVDIKMQPLVLGALIALALGLIISLMGFKFSNIAQFILGLAALSLFIYFFIDHKHQMNMEDAPPNAGGKSLLGDNGMKIDVIFLYGYWMAIGFTALSMILALLPLDKKKIVFEDFESNETEQPPLNNVNHTDESVNNEGGI
jgi:hypothetical protein